jgi:hypothetical protein
VERLQEVIDGQPLIVGADKRLTVDFCEPLLRI